ncbi:ATP-binding cassette sub-family C member Sur-like isoform X2 [Diachasmimorpha longicaudata]|uniref:ATP-binding cassette sub-family C member Sur-like isoform X2 n=1 Tax=Diachasmimorpha longicaudata TaxID=58733 RepID=UPI0030B8B4F4
MGLCENIAFLRLLPTSGYHIVWTWDAGNGTMIRMTTSASSRSDCFIELVNFIVVIISLIAALCLMIKYRLTDHRKCRNNLLPLHNVRSILCLLLLIFLTVELSEGLITHSWLLQLISLITIIICWFLHRATEIRDGLGLAVSGGAFTTIAVARLWRLIHLNRLELDLRHVRTISTLGTATVCAVLAVVDSYALYRIMERSKRYDIRGSGNTRSSYKHSQSVLLSKLTFHWVVEILSRGYRATLELNDLGDLPEEESTVIQFEKFRRIYDDEKNTSMDGRPSLWTCYWRRVWPAFVLGGVLKLFGDATTLVGPLVISRIVNYVAVCQNSTHKDRNIYGRYITWDELMENGYFLSIIIFGAAILQSTLSQASTHFFNVEGIRLRTALQALIYHKSLRLYSWTILEEEEPPKDDKDAQTKSHTADIGTLTNLMAEDAYNVMSFFWIGHYTWAIPLKIFAIIGLLHMKLGVSAIVGVICCILIVMPMQFSLGKRISRNLKTVAEKSDSRLKLLNEILQGMRLVKLRAWELIFERRIQHTRDIELSLLDKDSLYWGLITFLTHASSVLTTLFTFGVYFWVEETHLDAGNVFASLALFSQLTVPLFIFPVIVPIILNARISTKRLEDFLSLPETANVLPEVETRRTSDEDDEQTNSVSINESSGERNIQSISTFGTLGNITEDEEEHPCLHLLGKYETSSSCDTVFEKDAEPVKPALLYINGVFALGSEEAHLVVDELIIPRGKLTLIVGKTGSGKTSLISAMLGENPKLRGKIQWARDVKVAYVSQRPWLLNATLQENIIFGSTYNKNRYKSVLRACALQPDVDILPGKDMTRIGEKGINLSGGQKQRIAIARAIYSDADTIILDDPLSALDQQVSQQIFEQGIQKLLLRKSRTVIMVTHRLELIPFADNIVALENCRLRSVGPLSLIEATDPQLLQEWKEAAKRQADVIHRTAKDRWSLVRLVSRIAGFSAKHRQASDGSWMTEQDAHVSPPIFVPLRHRKSMLSESRYLAHDLTDLPVAVEEWGTLKKRSKRHRSAARAISLQPPKHPPPVLRQSSTPTILESHYIVPRKRHNTTGDSEQSTGMLRQLFSGKIIHLSDEGNLNTEKKVLKRLMSSSSMKNPEFEGRTIRRLISTESGTEDPEESQERCEENEEEQNYEDNGGIVDSRVWLAYLRAGGFGPCFMYLGAALGCQALRVYTDLWLSEWTNLGAGVIEESSSREQTVFYFRMYIILSIGSIVLSAFNSAAGQWAGAIARKRLHQEAINSLLRAPMNFFEQTPIGRILNRFSADVGVIDKKLPTAFQKLTFFVLLCGSAMIVNVIISPWFLVAAVPTSLAYFFLQKFYRNSARELQRLEGSTRGPVAAHFSETLAGLPIVRASKQQDRFMDDMIEHLDANTNAFLILNTSKQWLGIALLGICGRTGSGKSTTVMALFQLLEVSQGRILIDGIDLRRVSLLSLRSRLSAIPQDVIMFSGTIRENLDPLAEHQDDELWSALQLAQMKDIIASHPEGLDLEVREGGENFSSGQLQLLSMARATLRQSAVVVLDEATSALDASTEKSLLREMSNAFRKRTVITIAHRVASLLSCDRIIVFDEGKIVEEGTPNELSTKPLGSFAAMLRASEMGQSTDD